MTDSFPYVIIRKSTQEKCCSGFSFFPFSLNLTIKSVKFQNVFFTHKIFHKYVKLKSRRILNVVH